MTKKELEITNTNEGGIKPERDDLKDFLPDYYSIILKIFQNFEKYKNEINLFNDFRESKPTVNESTLEDFAKKYIRIIEAFWEIFFREELKRTYENVRIEIIDSSELPIKYIGTNGTLFYNNDGNTVVIVKDKFFKDFEYILKGDAGIILAFAHEIGHAVQTQYEKIFGKNRGRNVNYKGGKHIEDTLEYLKDILKQINTKIRLNENNADYFAGVIARILFESGIFNEDDLKKGETSFYFLGAFGCIDTHGTAEERRQMFRDGYKEGGKYVHLVKQKS